MSICPVCGCKTETIDFVKSNVGEWQGDVCSFCHKQLSSINLENGLSESQHRWVTAALSKYVANRDELLLKELGALTGNAPVSQKFEVEESAKPFDDTGRHSEINLNDTEAIRRLNERVTSLENELKKMKRTTLIKTILEIGIPVILGILILIVFFASGLFDALSGLYNEFV